MAKQIIKNREFKKNEYMKEITAEEFQKSGALWFINNILHLFGIAIVYDPIENSIKPAIVKYRGFDSNINDKGYKMLSNYLKNNINEIESECE